RRANAENNVALLNHFNVLALHRRLGRHLFLARRTKARTREVIAQAVRSILGNLRKGFAQFLVGKLTPFGEQFRKIPEDALDSLDVFRIAVDIQTMTAPVDLNIEQRLEVFNVLVVNAEKRFQSFGWKLDLFQLTKLSPGVLMAGRRV